MRATLHLRPALRALGALALALGLAGCPLQTPTFELTSPLAVMASAGAPLVGETITLTAVPSAQGVDLSAATWKSSNGSIVSLTSTAGATVMATAREVGTATLTVSAGSLQGTVTITVLASVGNVDLVGPTSLAKGQKATYTAAVTDAGGRTLGASVTWVANGSVALDAGGANTGPSMRIVAVGTGPGAVTAQAGGRSAQIAVKVAAMNGALVVTRSDGSPIGAMVSSTDTLTVEASYELTNAPAADAHWTSMGACALVGSSGSTLSVQLTGTGSCTLTVSAGGMRATASFTIVAVDGVAIAGDTKPLALGESRTYMATALSGTTAVPGVAVTWTTSDAQVLAVSPSGTSVTVKALGVGTTALKAATAQAAAMVSLTVAPSSIQITASSARVVLGSSAVVTARALGPTGLPGPFVATDGLRISGATGFSSAALGALTADGGVTFFLDDATAGSPAVTVSLGAVVSNELSFTLATIASVVVVGPQGPVRVGTTVDLMATALDGAGGRIDGNLTATWSDANGVYTFPAGNTLHVVGNVVKLGTSSIVATVMGVASPPFASPAQPASLGLSAFSPGSIPVGAKATVVVTVLDGAGAPIPGATVGQLSLSAGDPTKVSFDAGAVMGNGFLFTATGLAATLAAGTPVTATWTDGMFPIDSGAVPLVVTGN